MKVLPDDINKKWETLAIEKYHSKNLLAGLKYIRENKMYTKKQPGAYLLNTKTFKILCYVEAHAGVVKDFTVNVFVVHKDKKDSLAGLWNDEDTEFIIPDSKRHEEIDWYVPKKEKKNGMQKEEKR